MDKKETIKKIFTNFSLDHVYHDVVIEKYFHSAYKQLEKQFGCVYLSYIIESQLLGEKLQLSTSKEWNSFYYEHGLSETCHIAKICRKMHIQMRSYTINWNLIAPDDTKSRKTHTLRREFGFDNGATYATILKNNHFGSYFELINIVGNSLDLNFYKELQQSKVTVASILRFLRVKGYNSLSNRLNIITKYLQAPVKPC